LEIENWAARGVGRLTWQPLQMRQPQQHHVDERTVMASYVGLGYFEALLIEFELG
jgi:hypothetical protein